ncbi:MAG: hypothetical protein A3F54_00575 [Candidatus Kerfeldbacteria bacterium RIFCSPHIGHO2_12_FULL_48_17]|uniref:DUF5673 domain-containing protein n=1 Tax=Candidatus Kerfeldbacteria bacterium RIFCSPHIGHO2_12_FULL_48_17 TaxID=1798542 RepID=A0A1G2B5E6_9BACT|nr:MAG: hypothetical protein A3F54_00575 [Candidatus Kerfeldbacteria bacterium RIFCSPHIGHO2_12_FULL_48_17]
MAKKRKNKAKKSQKSQAVEQAAEEQSGRAADPMLGNIHAEWYFDEFATYDRDRQWYTIAIGIAVILLVYAIWTASYLFAIIILIVAIILFLQHKRQPLAIRFRIADKGISFDEKPYTWYELDNFWLAYQPPVVKRLYFVAKAEWKPEISIPLENQNPLVIRRILLRFLKEDLEKETETPADAIARRLRI